MIYGSGGFRDDEFELILLVDLINIDVMLAIHGSIIRLAEDFFNLLQCQVTQVRGLERTSKILLPLLKPITTCLPE